MLGVLYHLRHPLLAIDHVYTVSNPGSKLYLDTEIADWKLGAEPGVLFYRDDGLAGDPTNWFTPTLSALRGWLETSGFSVLTEQAWPEEAPRRAALSAERVRDVPLYQVNSYDVPLTSRRRE